MKKLLVIPVLICYLFAVSGVMVHLHYCGGNLESWTMFNKTSGCEEGECGDESSESDGCCKDKLVVKKVSNDQNYVSFFKLKLSCETIFTPALHFTPAGIRFFSADAGQAYQSNAPPGSWQNIPLYKLHQRFTYYG